MLTIKSMKDISRIQEQELLPAAMVEELQRYFKEVVMNLTGEDCWETYDLTKDGPMYVLQAGIDEPNNLSGLDFSMIMPEFADRLRIGDQNICRIVCVLDNSCCIVVFCEAGKFGEEFDHWVDEYIIEEGANAN